VVALRLADRFGEAVFLGARDATDEELCGVHTAAYLELVKRECASLGRARYLSTGDVVIDDASLAVARRAAGGAIVAAETAATTGKPTFALVRPPGHHAEAKAGMGFCLFNNAAVAARSHLHAHGGRVLVVDFDYHHGNGTQDVAGNGLSYVSTHAHPAYPGTGARSYHLGDGDEIVNVPLPVTGISTEAFVATWEQLLPAVARRIKPTMLVISAGFDYVKGDPVGDLGVDIEAATHLASIINLTAAEHNANIAYILEGGYDINALTESIAKIVDASDAERTAGSGADGHSSLA
jgi:acetoin utilization deacetylase AcuC-like enzyme